MPLIGFATPPRPRRFPANSEDPTIVTDNPLLKEFDTPFGVPPFALVRDEHFLPAMREGFERERAEIEAIATDPNPATFENTIEALEGTGELLGRVADVFYNLLGTDTNDARQAVAREIAPELSRHRDDTLLDSRLFERVRQVWEQRDALDLGLEASRLLEETYRTFVRCGARLDEAQKARLRAINEEMSVLSVDFGQNLLEQTNGYALVLDDPADLAGLPDSVVAAAREEAERRGHEGQWAFTLQKPSWIPFLQHSERRALRERLYRAYTERCDHDDEHDNKAIASRLAVLRAKKAAMLGYATHAHLVLEDTMAQTPEKVDELLRRLWTPARARAHAEADDLRRRLAADLGDQEVDGDPLRLEPWDWWFYAERARRERFDIDEDALRPYFSLDHVRQGAFEVAARLFGISFVERPEVPTYHEEVRSYEVLDGDGEHLGLFFTDYHPRAGKRVGAWMNTFRDQHFRGQTDVRPVVLNVGNLTPSTGDTPALLGLDEVLTLFHEFGHALHGLLTRCRYRSLSGTRVPRDFVELPSQVMENWAIEPEVLALYAHHWQTGEPIPVELVEKVRKAEKFGQGFRTTEYLAASFLDMAWHTLDPQDFADDDPGPDVHELEQRAMAEIGLPREILPRYRSTYFGHIFGGGYSAGYYSYIWAEVLDADAFHAFEQSGDLFHPELARGFRDHVLAKGYTEPPMELYRRFRGSEPGIEPLLERRGLRAPE